MNIIELDKLIEAIPPHETEMVNYYQAMRRKLVNSINKEIKEMMTCK